VGIRKRGRVAQAAAAVVEADLAVKRQTPNQPPPLNSNNNKRKSKASRNQTFS